MNIHYKISHGAFELVPPQSYGEWPNELNIMAGVIMEVLREDTANELIDMIEEISLDLLSNSA